MRNGSGSIIIGTIPADVEMKYFSGRGPARMGGLSVIPALKRDHVIDKGEQAMCCFLC
jgi:hypothetical protein